MAADRTEAAAEAMERYSDAVWERWSWTSSGQRAFAFVLRALAAADAHDRDNSIARIRLDDELAEKIAHLLYGVELTVGPPDRLAYDQARAVLDLLRGEALNQPQPERRTT